MIDLSSPALFEGKKALVTGAAGAVLGADVQERAIMADPRNYYAQEILKDGTPVTIRAIRTDDEEGFVTRSGLSIVRRYTDVSSLRRRI